MHSELKKVSRGVDPRSLNLPTFTAAEIQPFLPDEDWPSRSFSFSGHMFVPWAFSSFHVPADYLDHLKLFLCSRSTDNL